LTRRLSLLVVLAAFALLASACTRTLNSSGSGSIHAQPQDLYGAMPLLSDVSALLGDANWRPGPPSFGVRPLDVASMPLTEKFTVSQPFVHLGSAETFIVDYEVWSDSGAAKSHMTTVQTALGTSAITSPKVGDQVIYYGSQDSSAAPYQTVTLVRVGQVVAVIGWDLKDAFPKVAQLTKIATRVIARLNSVMAGKVHASPPAASDTAVLPPDSLDLTLLGSARIPVEAAVVMIGATSIDTLAQVLRSHGVSDVVFGDYALNADTHMEVRATVLTFTTAKEATDWLAPFVSSMAAGQEGYYDDTHGWYVFPFASGTRAAMIICQSTVSTEAASRACESPLTRVTAAWKVNLG
jgi:hypothetical protein